MFQLSIEWPAYPHAAMVIAIDGPAGAGKSTVARGVAGGARLHLPRLRGDVPQRRACGASRRASTSTTPRRSPSSPSDSTSRLVGSGVLLAGEDVSAAIRTPEVTAAASVVSVHPGVREAMVAAPAGDDRGRRLRRRGPRHRHRGQPRLAAQGLPHRERRGARPPPRRADRRAVRAGARGAGRARPPRPRARAWRAARRRRRGRARHDRARRRRGRRRGSSTLARERGLGRR